MKSRIDCSRGIHRSFSPAVAKPSLAVCILTACLAAAALGQSVYTPYAFTTLAGLAGTGSADGMGSAAQFNNPIGVATDSAGNAYVADTYNNTIRKITPAGMVTTLAGSAGQTGSADGTGGAAHFNSPMGVAVDAAGIVYVADTMNNTVRKITPAGVVTTLAGLAGNTGSADGSGSAARFFGPRDVAVDSAGNVYVADLGNRTIRKITPAGVVTTLAGLAGSSGGADGTGSAARFDHPEGVSLDSAGNVYVADTYNHTIRKVTPAGVVTTVAGVAGSPGNADGTGSAARFDHPNGVAVDSAGNVAVTDTYNNTIRKITPAGVVTTLAGRVGSMGSTDGTGGTARFYSPRGVAVDGSGSVYVADTGNSTVRKITPGGTVTTLAGLNQSAGSADGTSKTARFNQPYGVAVDGAGYVYVADTGNSTIRRITPAGVVTTLAGLAGSPGNADGTSNSARFNRPYGVAVDGAGYVYIADTGNSTIRRITPAGVVTTLAGLAGSPGNADATGSAARFTNPSSVAVDGAGNVLVADAGNHTIRRITSAGVVTTLAGLARNTGSADGIGSAARFNQPFGVAVDDAGNVYVADAGNNTIRKITSDGIVTTLAGLARNPDSADGTVSAARFNQPGGVAVDGAANVYVADIGNSTIRKITPAGLVTTLAGLAGNMGSADGTGSAAWFGWPSAVAVDSAGSVFVADSANNTIHKGHLYIAPQITAQPQSMTVNAGGTIALSVLASGTPPLSYEWRKNGAPLAGATDAQLILNNVTGANTGSYAVVVSSNTGDTVTSGNATVSVTSGQASRLANLSVRASLSSSQILIVGFTTNGAKSILLRGIGPTLTSFGLSGVFLDPRLELYSQATGAMVDSNDDWNQSLVPTFASLGAFPLTTGSKDAAVLRSVTGSTSAQLKGTGAGIVLVEVYDAGTGYSPKLVNVSARNFVGTDANVLIAGFVVDGSVAKTLLIRGVGPKLAAYGVSGTLANPKLEIYNQTGAKIAENDDWSAKVNEAVALQAAFAATGAFALDMGSNDAALLITLPPGPYSATIAGADRGTGEALVEVYEVP